MPHDYFVHVEGEASDESDTYVPGVYALSVEDSVDPDHRVSAVLDCFHANIAIATLDDFNITVTDGEGNVQIEWEESEPMRFEKMADLIDKVDDYPEIKRQASPGI